jgi:hypothetical protein
MTSSEKMGHAFCLLIALCALAAVGWAVYIGQAFTLDGLFLISVCLLFALLFSIIPMQAARRAGLFRKLARRKTSAQPEPEEAKISQTAHQKT